MTDFRQITYRSEVLRKGVHLSSLSIPVIYALIAKSTALWILIPLTGVFLIVNILGHRSGPVRTLMIRYLGDIMRTHELDVDRRVLNGASHVLIAACLSVLVFPKLVAITAFSILIISDICAALIGRRFGSHRFLDKSLEGTLAFAVSAVGVVLVIAHLVSAPVSFTMIGIVAGLVGSIIENISPRLRLDDNISIPCSVGTTLWLLSPLTREFPMPPWWV
jgi:dolichol kinase